MHGADMPLGTEFERDVDHRQAGAEQQDRCVLRKPFELTRMLAVVKAFCPSPALPPSPARGSAPAAA